MVTNHESRPVSSYAKKIGSAEKINHNRHMSEHGSNGKIKVAHIVYGLGGAGKELGILKLVAHLDAQRFESYIVVITHINMKEINSLDRFNIIHLNVGKGNQPDLPLKLAKVFRKHRFDIIHTHSWGTLLEGVLGAKLARSPAIIHGEHGTFPQKFPHSLVQRIFWGMADRVLSVSDVLGKQLSATTRFNNEKISVILNGVVSQNFFPDAVLRAEFRRRFHFRDDDFIVGTVGRYNPVKNFPMMVRGIAPLIQTGEIVEFAHVGGGWQAEKDGAALKNLAAELDVSAQVHLLGYQSEVNMIYNGFDVFTLTSFSEGCSNVIQEAMFAGKPVIATNVGGNPELVQDGVTGFLVESDNAAQWADALRKLKSDPALLKRMGENAREYALKNFSLKKMIDSYEQVYLDVYRKK